VLPAHLIPRLDSFDGGDYAALADGMLERTGRDSLRTLEGVYDGGEDGGEGMRDVVADMIGRRIAAGEEVPPSCLGFDSFHRLVAVVSSRAMVLRGTKHMTPLADMINYSPRPRGGGGGKGGRRREDADPPFTLYQGNAAAVKRGARRKSGRKVLEDVGATPAAVPLFLGAARVRRTMPQSSSPRGGDGGGCSTRGRQATAGRIREGDRRPSSSLPAARSIAGHLFPPASAHRGAPSVLETRSGRRRLQLQAESFRERRDSQQPGWGYWRLTARRELAEMLQIMCR